MTRSLTNVEWDEEEEEGEEERKKRTKIREDNW